jgi:transposase InsO family protein
MRREGMVACTERRFRWTATPRTELPAAPNHLQRDFTAAAPNRRWVSDMTSVRTGQGWLHRAIIYIAAFYNRIRQHSSVRYRSPEEHEALVAGI